MPNAIFPDKRTRSQLALPDDILAIPQRSPMKDAKKAQMAPRGANKSSDETEDELLLSPRKTEGRYKRSVTPEPQDEYSAVFGSPSCGRELKRVKRDTLKEGKDDDGKMALYLQRLDSRHARNTSETSLPAVKGKPRKRVATTSKKPTSTVSASPPPSVYSPVVSPKARAQSVPILTGNFPRIDFRNLPPTPMRSGSSSPVKEKLRITSGTFTRSFLPTISDEQTSAMDLSDGSTSIPEEKELPLIENPLVIQPLRHSRGFPVVPATPMTDSLDKLIPLSPLTPITETPFPGLFARDASSTDTASRYDVETGWSTDIFKEFESSASTAKTKNPPSMINSRLPRPIAPPNNNSVNPPQPSVLVSATPKEPVPDTSTTMGRKSVTATKRNAFDLLMKPHQAKAKLGGKEKLSKGVGRKSDMISRGSTARIPQPSIFAMSKGGEKPAAPLNRLGLKMRDKMRPRPKPKIQQQPLLIPMDDDEVENTTGDVGGGREAAGPRLESPDLSPTLAGSSTYVEEEIKEIGDAIGDVGMSVNHASEAATTAVTTKRDRTASLPTDKPASKANEPAQFEQPLKPGPSKLPVGKKRQPTSIVPVGRVTRSVSKQKGHEESSEPVRRKEPAATVPSALKRTASGRVKKSAPPTEETSAMDTDLIEETLPPGSPMKTSSPAKTPPRNHSATAEDESQTINFGAGKLTLAKSPARTKSFIKPASTPSPSKIARATSMFIKPTITNVSRTFSTDLGNPASAVSGSSLSTLSNALEKLRMPPPSRPNTSMGFNEDLPGEDNDVSKPSTKDDADLGRESLGRSAVGLKRSVTFGAGVFRRADTSSSKTEGKSKFFVQKPLSAFMKGASNGTSGKQAGNKLPHFGVGGPIRRTISKKSSLPMVVGSPVKGENHKKLMDDNPSEDESGAAGNDSSTFFAPPNTSTGSLVFEDLEGAQSSRGKEKAMSKASNASRRVSMVSHALSQSLNSLPQSSSQGLMGPPPTPPEGSRSASSQFPLSSTSEKASPRQGPSTAAGTRSSARIATKISQTKVQDDAQNSLKDAQPPTNPVPESLKILNDCVIFVDVRTDEGGEAGSLFVEMLEGIGAKVLSRVGQTCTHIVYMNGLMSTLTRYRLLRDPKPLVVGVGWVVECAEQRKHVDETSHLVDLDGVNVAGINKRRRSILPKLLADASDSSPLGNENGGEEERDDSLNLSSSQDDDLAPLERARRRKSTIVGLHS